MVREALRQVWLKGEVIAMRKATKKSTRKKAAPKKKAAKKVAARRQGGKLWSSIEVRRLTQLYRKMTVPEIAKRLRRSVASVRGKISMLGLTKPKVWKKAAPKRRKAAPKKKAVKKRRSPRAATKKKMIGGFGSAIRKRLTRRCASS